MQAETDETERPTVHEYDYEPCPECDSTSFWEERLEEDSTSIRGYWDGDEYEVIERLPNHQGPTKIAYLECQDCGYVLIGGDETANDGSFEITEDQIKRIRDNLESIRRKSELEGIDHTAAFTASILDEVERGDGGE